MLEVGHLKHESTRLGPFSGTLLRQRPFKSNTKDDTTTIGSNVPPQNHGYEYVGYPISSLPPVVLVLYELNVLNCHPLDC